jgi:hypothetical protein
MPRRRDFDALPAHERAALSVRWIDRALRTHLAPLIEDQGQEPAPDLRGDDLAAVAGVVVAYLRRTRDAEPVNRSVLPLPRSWDSPEFRRGCIVSGLIAALDRPSETLLDASGTDAIASCCVSAAFFAAPRSFAMVHEVQLQDEEIRSVRDE